MKKTKKKKIIFFSDNRFKSTYDVSEEKIYDEYSNNKYNDVKTISEFDIKENGSKKYDIIIENNKNNKDKNENSFISKNVNTFSFSFKDQDNDNNDINNTYTFQDCTSKNSANINDNNENIDDEDDSNNKSNRNTINHFTNILNLSVKNRIFYTDNNYYDIKLKNLFVANISNKLSIYLILILNKLHLFDFIKIFSQKIKKSINQYVFQMIILSLNKYKKEYIYNDNNELFFFSVLKRHIVYNIKINENNEIKMLLKENIPKLFDNNNNNNIINYNISIPYLNEIQQKNLIDKQLFLNDNNNNKNLIKYFIGFYTNEKSNCILDLIILNNKLNNNRLYNRNIFTITKYMDKIYNSIFKNTKNYNKMKIKQLLLKKFNSEADDDDKVNECDIPRDSLEGVNNDFFKEIDEEIGSKDSQDNDESNKIMTINNGNNYNYCKNNPVYNLSEMFCNNYNNTNNTLMNQSNYKFIDYLNEKCKNNKIIESHPGTAREIIYVDSFNNI